jgi:nucleoside phosphorylase
MNQEVRSLVCFALKEEAAPFRKLCAGRTEVVIVLTGVGRDNTERSMRKCLAQYSPAGVLTCGFAGGLDPALKVGDVVFFTQDRVLRDELMNAGARPAKFFCAATIAATAADKEQLRRTTGADAVEMESELIQEICRQTGIPCATVRVISDAADEDLPLDFNRLHKPDWSLDYGRLIGALARSPGKIGALLRFRKRISSAAGRLADTLAKVIWPA